MDRIKKIIEELNAAPKRPIPDKFADTDVMIGMSYEMARDYLVGSNDNELAPTWSMVTENGQTVLVTTPFGDGDSKNAVANGMRKFMREAKVMRYTFTTEAWIASTTKEEWETDKRPPSKRDDRMEIVMVVGCDRSGASVKIYEIVREWETGKVTNLKPLDPERTMDGFEGRFANLLADEH